MIIHIILGISIALNIALIYGAWNLIKKSEAVEDLLRETVLESKEHISNALVQMKNSDIKGSFEADDEVGVAFQDIKNALENLNAKF